MEKILNTLLTIAKIVMFLAIAFCAIMFAIKYEPTKTNVPSRIDVKHSGYIKNSEIAW